MASVAAAHGVEVAWIVELAREAGAVIREANLREKAIEYKGENDLVTATDRAVEELLIGRIRNKFPTHAFLAEESASDAAETPVLGDAPTWIIDPVDGTTNFAHGFPFVAVSIAFAVDRRPLIGVVYNPIHDEMFWAERGSGAFLNGRRIHCSSQRSIGRSLISTGFNAYVVGDERSRGVYASAGIPFPNGKPPTKDVDPPLPTSKILDATVHNLLAAISLGQDVRRCGSAALDMANVACGRADMYFEWGPREWDFAAALVLVEEAGGVVLNFDGSTFELAGREAVVANSAELALQLTPYLRRPV